MKLKFLVALGIAATLYSCDGETTGIGQFVADNDMIPAKADSYTIETRSHLLDSVYSRSSTAISVNLQIRIMALSVLIF